MSEVKAGIVGCGFIATRRHIPAFLRLKNHLALTAVCDINKTRAVSVAGEFGVPNSYTSISEMLEKEDLDIVDICTHPQAHAPLAVEAAEHGCHVLLEKPMALSVADCDEMIRASRKHGSQLSVIHNEIFHPVFLKAKELAKAGVIGKLTGMRWLRLTPKTEYMAVRDHWVHNLPGGILGETGPHAVYTSLQFLHSVKDVKICARKLSEEPWILYDDFRIELEGENITSSIMISHATECQGADIELIGTYGMLKIDLQSMILTHYNRKNLNMVHIASSSLAISGQTFRGVASNAFSVLTGRARIGHEIAIEKFVDSIVDNQPVPISPEEGRETVKVMEMIVAKLQDAEEQHQNNTA